MTDTNSSITTKSLWTMGTYAVSSGIRFSTNIVLSRLLGPEVLGIVVVAQAVRAGSELLTDMGLEQNVVHSPQGNDARFLNTVWTIQILRGVLISIVCAGLSFFLAGFYRVEVAILLAMSAAPLLNSLTSTSIFTLSKTLNVKTRNLFELLVEVIGLAMTFTLAFATRNAWGPILGILLTLAIRSLLTYYLPHPRHKFVLDMGHVRSIFHFSKWIMLSSLALYAAVYIDRLFLAKVVSLSTLGIYGLARAISDLPHVVAGRLAFQIVFPYTASLEGGDGTPNTELIRTRRLFLVVVGAGIATVMAWSDWAIHILYGSQYEQAGWMLFLLLTGSWISVLASLNEATVFGRGKPKSVAFANVVRVVVMSSVLTAGYHFGGLPGAILALPASEVIRYVILVLSQRKLGISFVVQDLSITLGVVAVLSGWLGLRLAAGLGVPWALIPWS